MASKQFNLDFKTAFTRWISREAQKHLSILVTGKTGVGKSRLVNALVGKRVAIEGQQKKPCTATVNSYSLVINDIEVLVLDSTILQDGTCNEELYLEDMRKELRQGLDIMIYCIKMDDKRFHNEDKNAIRVVTREFGKDLWNNAVIALTFANKIDDPDGGDELEYFSRDLTFWRDEIDKFLASDGEIELDAAIRKEIPLVPVGIGRKLRLPTCENWLSELWITCYRRMKNSARINLYRINRNRYKFPEGSLNIEAACSSEVQTEITTVQRGDDQIPDEITLNQEQHHEFWKTTCEAFKELVAPVGVLLDLFSQPSGHQISKKQDSKPEETHQKSMRGSHFFSQPSDQIPEEQYTQPKETHQESMPGNPDENSIVKATMKFEAEHEECLGVYPYDNNGKVVVHLYVYSGKSGIPAGLKSDAEEFFGKMGVKQKWFDLYNDTYNVLNVTPIEYPSWKPNSLEASQVDEMDKVINKHLHVFSNHRNITALQPSFKITKSVETEEACITVYVLGKGNIPLGESAIPCTIGSYPVDIVNGFCVRINNPQKSTNPTEPIEAHKQKEVLCLGASIGVNGEQSSGTLGALVEDVNSGTLYALSCDHVMNHDVKSEIINPGFDIYLNTLHWYLNNYKALLRRIKIPKDHCELPQLSIDIHRNPAELLVTFNELKAIKERNSTRAAPDILEKIREEEKFLEEAFSKPPRTVAKYCAGIRHNVQAKNSGKEHFIDAAISVLEEKEQNNLKLGRSITIIGSRLSPNGECIPATTNDIMGVEDLCKSGSATGFTESSSLLGVNLSPPMTIKAFRPQGECNPWIDYQCINCEKREASQSQAETLSSPCVLCKPDRWLKSCLCIQKPGHRVFSDIGDSGAVIFEMRKDKNGDNETYLPGLGIIFALHTSQHFTFSIASPLQPALEALSQKVTDSRTDRRPCKLRLASELRWLT